MERFRIEGGRRLEGTVLISGAKNSALPAMAAALLTAEPVHLENIPRVRDIITMGQLLAHMGARVEMPDVPPTGLTVKARKVVYDAEAPYDLVRTMRASILTLGPLMARLWSCDRFSARADAPSVRVPSICTWKALEQDGRRNQHRGRLREGPGAGRTLARGAYRFRQDYGYRNGESIDGRVGSPKARPGWTTALASRR